MILGTSGGIPPSPGEFVSPLAGGEEVEEPSPGGGPSASPSPLRMPSPLEIDVGVTEEREED